MWYSPRSHCCLLAMEHRRRFGFRGIDHADIETNASGHNSSDVEPNASTAISLRTTQCGTEHRKCAGFLIEKATEERGKIWRGVIAGGTEDHQWLLAKLMALPQECRQVGNMVGMKVAYADHPQIFKFR